MTRKLFVPLCVTLLTATTLSVATVAEAATPRSRAPARCVVPMSSNGQPLLGFMGVMIYGQGLEVQSVNPGSLAAQIGLEPGDLITAINGQAVLSLPDYYALLRASGGLVEMEVFDVRGTGTIGLQFYLDNGVSDPGQCAPGQGGARPGLPSSRPMSGFNGRPQFTPSTVIPPRSNLPRPRVVYRIPGRP